MSSQALIEHPTAQQEHQQLRKKRIPRKIGEVIQLLVTGECRNIKQAAEQAGMHPNYVYGALKKPEIIAHLEHQTRVALARSQAPAAATLIRLATDAASEHVQKDAAIHLLNIAGHKPRPDTQVSVNVEIKAGYVIDLSDTRDHPPIIDVTHD